MNRFPPNKQHPQAPPNSNLTSNATAQHPHQHLQTNSDCSAQTSTSNGTRTASQRRHCQQLPYHLQCTPSQHLQYQPGPVGRKQTFSSKNFYGFQLSKITKLLGERPHYESKRSADSHGTLQVHVAAAQGGPERSGGLPAMDGPFKGPFWCAMARKTQVNKQVQWLGAMNHDPERP